MTQPVSSAQHGGPDKAAPPAPASVPRTDSASTRREREFGPDHYASRGHQLEVN